MRNSKTVSFTVAIVMLPCFWEACSPEVTERTRQSDEIAAIVLRHTGFDIKPFTCSIRLDTVKPEGTFETSYERATILSFDSLQFEFLKASIRRTPYFGIWTYEDDEWETESWDLRAPGATHGVWEYGTDGYWYCRRCDGKDSNPEGESLTLHVDTVLHTLEFNFYYYKEE